MPAWLEGMKAEVEKARSSLGAEFGTLFEAPSHFRRAELRRLGQMLDAWPPVSAPAGVTQALGGAARVQLLERRRAVAFPPIRDHVVGCWLTKSIQASRFQLVFMELAVFDSLVWDS